MLTFLTFFPLIGGYFAVSALYFTRIHAARADGYRLIFYALGAGFGLYIISSALAPCVYWLLLNVEFLGRLVSSIQGHFTIHDTQSALTIFKGESSNFQFLIACLSLVIGWPIALALNWLGNLEVKLFRFLSKNFAVQRSISSRADPLEKFLNEALHSATPVLLTLQSGKIYAGTVTSELNPAYDPASIQIEMLKSGYRDQTHRKVVFNTDYKLISDEIKRQVEERSFKILKSLLESKASTLNKKTIIDQVIDKLAQDSDTMILAHERLVAIPYSEIESIHQFSEKIYDAHRNQADEEDTIQSTNSPSSLG